MELTRPTPKQTVQEVRSRCYHCAVVVVVAAAAAAAETLASLHARIGSRSRMASRSHVPTVVEATAPYRSRGGPW